MTCITTALRGIYARLCYFTPRCINDDESHFAPRNPGKGLTRGTEVHATRALIRYPIHKREEGRGFLLWDTSVEANSALLTIGSETSFFYQALWSAGPHRPHSGPPSSHGQSDDLMNHGAPICRFFFRLCLLGKILPWYQCFNGGRRACLCNMVLTFVSLLVAL